MHLMRLRGIDGTCTALETADNSCVQKLLEFSLAVTMEKIRDTAGTKILVEVHNSVHRKEFSPSAFK